MTEHPPIDRLHDVAIIGGGINGAGIARDAAGRGLSVALIEAGDIGGATSSASTKLIHGGLRYLEFYAFGLVRKALAEREVLLNIAAHITWPQSFILPVSKGGRPVWMLRLGLWLYDHLARRRIVPSSTAVDLRQDRAGRALATRFTAAFRYWDGWVDDARLVVANVQDAAAHGALILPRTRVRRAAHDGSAWTLTLEDGRTLRALQIVNAAGPWAASVARDVMGLQDGPSLRLVQGSHIVTRRVHLGRDAFNLQEPDGRVVFVIPYEKDFSLIGTTERDIAAPEAAAITEEEEAYLLAAANRYLSRPLAADDVVHRYAGVRPLVLEAGKGDRETTRDYKLLLHEGVPALTVVGGKITTYRVLAEAVMKKIAPKSKAWTHDAPLPGSTMERLAGETGQEAFDRWMTNLVAANVNYDPKLVKRLARTLGTAVEPMLEKGLGENIGGLFEAELQHYVDHEWATCADDVLWRRTKMGLHIGSAGRAAVAAWFGETSAPAGVDAPRSHRFATPGSDAA